MKRAVSILNFGILLTSLVSVAYADKASDFSYSNQWNSGQISTLGGIGTLSDNFVDRFMINPATPIEDSRSLVFQWLSISANITKDLRNTVNDISNTLQKNQSKKSSQTQQIVDVMDNIQAAFGRRLGGGANISLLAAKVYGLALIPYISVSLDAEARVPQWPSFDGIADTVAGVGIGYSHQMTPSLTVGASVKPGYRYYAAADVDASSIGGDLTGTSDAATDSLAVYGGGVVAPVDIGVIYKTEIPTLDITSSIQNIVGGQAMSTLDTSPPDYPIRWRLGVDYTPYEGHGHRVVVASELQDILRLFEDKSALWFRWQWAAKYRYQFAGERLALGVNAGLQSGYSSFGVYADLWFLKMDAGLYTKEAGLYPGQKTERRYIVSLSTETGF